MKTRDDWDELAGALSAALPYGVDVYFPGRQGDEDYDLRLIPGEDGYARLVIDLADADTAHSEETIYLEWGLNTNEDEPCPDLQWWTRDWSRSGVGDTDSPQAMDEAMNNLAGDIIGAVLDTVQHLAGGEREDGAIYYNDQGRVEVDDDLRYVLTDAYDKGAADVMACLREEFLDAGLEEAEDQGVFVNRDNGRALILEVDLRYPCDGGSKCTLRKVHSRGGFTTMFLARGAERLLSNEDRARVRAAVAWLNGKTEEKEGTVERPHAA